MATSATHDVWTYKSVEEEDSFQSWMQERVLSTGEDYCVSVGVHTLHMKLCWQGDVDVDASSALYTADGTLHDAVCFRQLGSKCGSITHSGDEGANETESKSEIISVELGDVPLEVHHVVFVASVFDADVSFEKVNSARVTMTSGDENTKGNELFTFTLSGLCENAVLVGLLTRKHSYWSFKALGEPILGCDIREVLKGESIQRHVLANLSEAPAGRKISATVIEGRNLAAKDVQLLFWREPSSDPYYRIKFGKREFKSRHVEKTLHPKWEEKPFTLGAIIEADTRPLEIFVFDYDTFSEDDFMGVVRVTGRELYGLGQGEHYYWFPLLEDNRYEKEEVSGEILVRFDIEAPPLIPA